MNVMTNKFLAFIQFAIIAVLCAPSTFAVAAATGNPDRVSVPLSDPTRPAFIKAHLLNGGITVKGYEGKAVIVEARARASEDGDKESHGHEQWARSGRQAVGHAILPGIVPRNWAPKESFPGIVAEIVARQEARPPTRAWSHDGLVPDIVRDRPAAGPKKNRTLAGPVVVRRRGGRHHLPEGNNCQRSLA